MVSKTIPKWEGPITPARNTDSSASTAKVFQTGNVSVQKTCATQQHIPQHFIISTLVLTSQSKHRE